MRVSSEFHRRQMFFFGSTGPPSCGHRGKTPRLPVRSSAVTTAAVKLRRWRELCAVVACVGRVTGATLPRSVTVGDRLAQKSDRHRPLSLRPVSLRRRIYMQFLLIVLLYRGGFNRRGDQAAAATTTSAAPPPTPL